MYYILLKYVIALNTYKYIQLTRDSKMFESFSRTKCFFEVWGKHVTIFKQRCWISQNGESTQIYFAPAVVLQFIKWSMLNSIIWSTQKITSPKIIKLTRKFVPWPALFEGEIIPMLKINKLNWHQQTWQRFRKWYFINKTIRS